MILEEEPGTEQIIREARREVNPFATQEEAMVPSCQSEALSI